MKCTPAQLLREIAHPSLGLRAWSDVIVGIIQMQSIVDEMDLRYAFNLPVIPCLSALG